MQCGIAKLKTSRRMSEAPCTSAGGQTPKKRAKSRARQDPPNPTSIYLSLYASPETYRSPPAKSVAVTTLQQQAFRWPEFWRTTGSRIRGNDFHRWSGHRSSILLRICLAFVMAFAMAHSRAGHGLTPVSLSFRAARIVAAKRLRISAAHPLGPPPETARHRVQ